MIIIDKSLYCDKCHELFGEYYHFAGNYQRELAKKEGWVYIKGKDYCPVCKPNKPIHPKEG